jgi:hypothetical protein
MVMSKTNNDISSRCPSWRAKVAGWGLGTQRAWRALYLFTCGISEQVPIFYGMFDIPKHTPIFLGGKWSLVPIVFWFLNISWKLPEMEEYGTIHTMVSSCFIHSLWFCSYSVQKMWRLICWVALIQNRHRHIVLTFSWKAYTVIYM